MNFDLISEGYELKIAATSGFTGIFDLLAIICVWMLVLWGNGRFPNQNNEIIYFNI